MSRGKADLGGIDLPLDDVENGNVAILVGSAQVLLNAGAHLRNYHSGQFLITSKIKIFTIIFFGWSSLLITSRTVVFRTFAKSWSDVNGVKPVIRK